MELKYMVEQLVFQDIGWWESSVSIDWSIFNDHNTVTCYNCPYEVMQTDGYDTGNLIVDIKQCYWYDEEDNDARLMLSNSKLYQNSATSGGAVFIVCGNWYLNNNTIELNTAQQGAGVWMRYNTDINNSKLFENDADIRGGGGYFECMNEFTFGNSSVESNTAAIGLVFIMNIVMELIFIVVDLIQIMPTFEVQMQSGMI